MSKSATVYTNDPKNKTISLQLSAKVTAFARYPKRITLKGKVGETISVKHTIVPEPQYQFDIVKTYADNGKHIKFNLEKQTSQFTLTVENTRKTDGRYWDRIHLVTDSDKQKEISIPVYGNITEASPDETSKDAASTGKVSD